MPIRALTTELVQEIIQSYGQVRKLNLSMNEISQVENLEGLTCLTKLNLFGNRLGPSRESLAGLARLSCLRELDLSDNNITTLEPLSLASASLKTLNVANNAVTHFQEVAFLSPLKFLNNLVLRGNPVAGHSDYRRRVSSFLPGLQILDDAGIQQKGTAVVDDTLLFLGTPVETPIGTPVDREMTRADISLGTPSELMKSPSSSDPRETRIRSTQEVSRDPSDGHLSILNKTQEQLKIRANETDFVDKQTVFVDKQTVEADGNKPSETLRHVDEGPTPKNLGSFTRNGTQDVTGGSGDMTMECHKCEEEGVTNIDEVASSGFQRRLNAGPAEWGTPDRTLPRNSTVPLGAPDTVVPDSPQGCSEAIDTPKGSAASSRDTVSLCLRGRQTHGFAFNDVSSQPRPVSAPPCDLHIIDLASCAQGLGTSDEVLEAPAKENGNEDRGERVGIGSLSQLQKERRTSHDTSSMGQPRGAGALEDTMLPKRKSGLPDWPPEHPGIAVPPPSPPPHRDCGSNPRNPFAAENPGSEIHDVASQRPVRGAQEFSAFRCERSAQGKLHLADERPNAQGTVDDGDSHVRSLLSPPGGSNGALHKGWDGRLSSSSSPTVKSTKFHTPRSDARSKLGKESSQQTSGKKGETQLAYPISGAEPDPWSSSPYSCGEEGFPRWTRQAGPVRAGCGNSESNASKVDIGRSRDDVQVSESPKMITIDGRDWESVRRENDSLRRQLELVQKRCSALWQMQQLTDKRLAREYDSQYEVVEARQWTHDGRVGRETSEIEDSADGAPTTDGIQLAPNGRPKNPPQGFSEESCSGVMSGEKRQGGDGVMKLLSLWRMEVLKLLLQQGQATEAAANESRKAAQEVQNERKRRMQAEEHAKGTLQRALAAEAEAELVNVRLDRALEDLRETQKGRRVAEGSSRGHAAAIRGLRQWLRAFVSKASNGFFEREAVLARGIARLEAFSQRLGLAAGRLEVVRTLLQRKEVQLRNSRAALVADRRVWLLERRQRELAALAKFKLTLPASSASNGASCPRHGVLSDGGSAGEDGLGVYPGSYLLEGLRPECEAVMRALFCRVDRLGTGAVRARHLLSVLRSDWGVSQLMEAAVGARRWRSALDHMEAHLCPSSGINMDGSEAHAWVGLSFDERDLPNDREDDERDVTWGEFLLFFLPSLGGADHAYNAGLVVPRERSGDMSKAFHSNANAAEYPVMQTSLGKSRSRGSRLGHVTEDAIALLQMIVPADWAPHGIASTGSLPSSTNLGGVSDVDRGLEALSVGQLQGEVRRLGRERGYLMKLLREDARLGARRSEAVHDQYRHELRNFNTRVEDLEASLAEAMKQADQQCGRVNALERALSDAREETQRIQGESQRRVDEVATEKTLALEAASREASQAVSVAQERIARLEAEHALALKENGKASVRQRALERELTRMRNSLETEAKVEKEALEERLRAGESKLAVARRERNALLAALRDMRDTRDMRDNQNKGRILEAHPGVYLSSSARSQVAMTVAGSEKVDPMTVDNQHDANREQDTQGTAGLAKQVAEPQAPMHDGKVTWTGDFGHPQLSSSIVGDQIPDALIADASSIPEAETEKHGWKRGGHPVAMDRSGKSIALADRLEQLVLQTEQLLEEDSADDTSCSDDGFDPP